MIFNTIILRMVGYSWSYSMMISSLARGQYDALKMEFVNSNGYGFCLNIMARDWVTACCRSCCPLPARSDIKRFGLRRHLYIKNAPFNSRNGWGFTKFPDTKQLTKMTSRWKCFYD